MNERKWTRIKEEARKLVELTPQIQEYLERTINGYKNEAIQACGQNDAIFEFSLGFNYLYNEIKDLKDAHLLKGKIPYFGSTDCKTIAMILIACNSYTEYKLPLYLKATDILRKKQCEAYTEDLKELLNSKNVDHKITRWSMLNFTMLRDKEFLLNVIA